MSVRGALQLECADDLFELGRLLLHRMGCRCRLLHQRGILLGGVVELNDGLVDLADARFLLLAGQQDLADDVGNLVGAGDDLVHGGASLVDQLGTGVDVVHRFNDQRADLLGRRGRAVRQVAYLGRHHGKAAALFAGPGRLDGRVQRQDVGLERDPVDDADNVGDFLRRVFDRAHRLDHLRHHRAAPRRHLRGVQRQPVGLLAAADVLPDGAGQLLHRRGGLLERAGLAFGTCRQILVAAGDFSRSERDRRRAGADFAHHLLQPLDEGVEAAGHIVELAAAAARQAPRQVGVAGRQRIDIALEYAQASHEQADAADEHGQQQQGDGDLHHAQLAQDAVALLGQLAGRQTGRQHPRTARYRLQKQRVVRAVAAILRFGHALRIELGQQAADFRHHRRTGRQILDFLEYDLVLDIRTVADDLAVAFDDQDLAVDRFLHVGHQAVEKAQRDIDGGNAVQLVVLVDRHGAVGARLRTGVVLVGLGPVAMALGRLEPAQIPALLEVLQRLRRVPVGVDDQFVGRIAGEKGAELVALGIALFRQWPDAAAKHIRVGILVDQSRQQDIDRRAVHQRHRLGDAALLRLHLSQLLGNPGGNFADVKTDHHALGAFQIRRDEKMDDGQGHDQQHHKNKTEQGDKTGLARAKYVSHNVSFLMTHGALYRSIIVFIQI